jgi:nucleoside-diphosphate-sugar epimerase
VRIVVLGGTRFIGKAIVAELVSHGHRVLVVHRGLTEPPDLHRSVEHLHVSRDGLHDREYRLQAWLPDGAVDCLAMSRADASAALTALPQGIRLVVLSSQDVYRAFGSVWSGRVTDPVPLDETSRLRDGPPPDGAGGDADYDKLHVEDEYLARRATVLRLPMVYGEDDYQRREEFVLRRVRARRRQMPFGAGTFLCSRVHVTDAATAVRQALESDVMLAGGHIYNVAERHTPSIELWARQILAAAGASNLELVPVPDPDVPDDLRITRAIRQHLLVSAARIRADLGWSDSDPEQAVEQSVKWHLANPPADASPDFSADDLALAHARA